MKRKIDKLMIISTVICLIPIILSLIIYDKLPDELPTKLYCWYKIALDLK